MRWLGQFSVSSKSLHFETEGVRWGLKDSYLPLGNQAACLSGQYQEPPSHLTGDSPQYDLPSLTSWIRYFQSHLFDISHISAFDFCQLFH